MKPIPIYVGWDARESVAYHVFCSSVLTRATVPVSFTPLALHNLSLYEETHEDGSNAFIYSRFLVPYLQEFQGWAIFADGDMICQEDIHELWRLRDERYAAMVVKHDYKTKEPIKYLGNKNEDYPRKNWSSLVLWNCAHPSNFVLTPHYIARATGAKLHRFQHLADAEIGALPKEWNWLVGEYEDNPSASLLHYTLGIPAFHRYAQQGHAAEWWAEEKVMGNIEFTMDRKPK